MKIAEIANIREAVPPLQYGGTEYVISAVTEGMTNAGHNVTLFATGDSKTAANLDSICENAIRYDSSVEQEAAMLLIRHMVNIAQKMNDQDLIHNHILESFALLPNTTKPFVTTLHTDLARKPEQVILQRPEIQNTFFISISDSQRKPLPDLPYIRTIYHGIPVHEYPFEEQGGDYLVFLGRITPEKGVEEAVTTAKATNRKLIVAAKVDEPLSDYAKKMLKIFKETPNVDFIGQIGEEKKELLANAYALLMPIKWEEPFGLVVIEALSTGTPVIAFRRGSMPEIIRNGETGFIVNTTKEMIGALEKIPAIDRRVCRNDVKQRFSVERMVADYEATFEELLR